MDFSTIQGILALFTSAILLIQLLAGFFIGADSDIDVDGDSSGDFDLSTIFSPKGILHFICGSSWYLVILGKSVFSLKDYLVAGLIGILFMLLIVSIYWLMYKLENYVKREEGEALIGRSGEVYLKLSEKDDLYTYIVKVKINESLQELVVISDLLYLVGDRVIIREYKDGRYYI